MPSLLFLMSSCSRIADEDGCVAVVAAGDILLEVTTAADEGVKLPLSAFVLGGIFNLGESVVNVVNVATSGSAL